jgi:hypothetical protein
MRTLIKEKAPGAYGINMENETDPELKAIQGVMNSIKDLDKEGKHRVLDYVLKRYDLVISSPTHDTTVKKEVPEGVGPERFAAAAGIETEALTNIYDLKDNSVYIHKVIDGSDAEKQRIATKLSLVAHEEVLGIPELTGKALGKQMTELGIGSMANFAKNLKSDEGIIVRGSRYKLNAKGRKEALDLVRQYSV